LTAKNEPEVKVGMTISAISIVIPVFNEFENVPLLADEIDEVMREIGIQWECIWVDDCSTDGSWKSISALKQHHKGIQLQRNSGQSTALMAGIDQAFYEVILTLDADLQNDPHDIPKFLENFSDAVDVVTGYRTDRKDEIVRRKIPSKIANYLSRKITGVRVKDLGCTMRIFRKELIQRSRLVGEMHRVILVHFALSGARIIEIQTNHRKRIFGASKYGLERTLKFVADLLLAKLMNIITNKPLYFFGSTSLLTFLVSVLLSGTAILLRLSGIKDYIDTSLIVGSLILLSTSTLLFCLGLLAEVLLRVFHTRPNVTQYSISNFHNTTLRS
jgi:glycosyltransferase involved in cell wall biosynthesis